MEPKMHPNIIVKFSAMRKSKLQVKFCVNCVNGKGYIASRQSVPLTHILMLPEIPPKTSVSGCMGSLT